MKATAQRPDVLMHLEPGARFLVLPVNWRKGVKFVHATEMSPDCFAPPTLSAIRGIVGDLIMDLPYYMSHHREVMLTAAAAEANRLYAFVCENHPKFAHSGRVNFVGHSLGSLIVADLLSMQPTDWQDAEGPFKFNVQKYFTTGSPLSFFLYLKGSTLIPRQLHDPSTPPPFGCLAVQSIYNLVNHSDVIAFLLNPAVAQNPIKHPSILGQAKSRFTFRRREPIKTVHTTSELELLNDYGQMDWLVPVNQRMGNQYLKIFTAHFDYWTNPLVAKFFAIECGRQPGPEHAVDEYKVMATQLLDS